jgi:hypothetical protein
VFSQNLKLASLGLLLVTLGLLLWPGSFHQIAEGGDDSGRVHSFTTRVMGVALLPFAVAISLDFAVAAEKLFGSLAAVIAAVIAIAVPGFFWYVFELLDRHGHSLQEDAKEAPRVPTPLENKIRQVLTEARVVLPGAQALLGFQFIAILAEGFEKLPESSKLIHFGSLSLVTLSTILLMTPAAYHRLVERGEDTEHFHGVASRFVMAAMIPLALGLCGDFYVVTAKITQAQTFAIASATALLALFFGLWFGYTSYARQASGGAGVRHGHTEDAVARVH